MDVISEIARLLPERVERALSLWRRNGGVMEEIRLKANSPVSLLQGGKVFYLSKTGELSSIQNNPILLSTRDVEDVFLRLCKTSVYAREKDIERGFVTYLGCRCGLYGRGITDQEGNPKGFSAIEGIHIRMAREIKNCAKLLTEAVLREGEIYSTLLVSPPCAGKTTMLRDLALQLSKLGQRVVAVDERGELSGEGRFDLGANTQVLAGIRKAIAMEMAVRTLNPSVLLIDEIGSMEEVESLLGAVHTGVPIVASAHALHIKQLFLRPQFRVLRQAEVMEQVVVLDKQHLGRIQSIYDLRGAEDETTGGAAGHSVHLWDIRDTGRLSEETVGSFARL